MMDRIEAATNDCLASARPGRETVENHSTIVLRWSKFLNDCSETLRTRLNDCFETLLKILKGFKDSFFEKDSSSNQDSLSSVRERRLAKTVAEVTSSENEWRLDCILSNASEKQRFLLQKQERNAVAFVSRLIQGISHPRIQNPYSLAISKLAESPQKGVGGACERVAALPTGSPGFFDTTTAFALPPIE